MMLLAQISDIHVRPEGQLYKGVVDSNAMLEQAIDHLHQLDRRPDLVLITGDIVDEGSPQEYANAVALLGKLRLPYRIMAGNHDNAANLRAAFAGHRYLPAVGPLNYCVDEFALRIIALDSTVANFHHGDLSVQTLDWLRAELQREPERPTIVALHHPPFACGIPYLDKYRYQNAQDLHKIIAAAPQVEAIVCGHVHRTMLQRWAGTVVCACPSTTTQIALQFQPDAKPHSFEGPAACLLHWWTPDSGLVTHTSYIGDYRGPFPFF